MINDPLSVCLSLCVSFSLGVFVFLCVHLYVRLFLSIWFYCRACLCPPVCFLFSHVTLKHLKMYNIVYTSYYLFFLFPFLEFRDCCCGILASGFIDWFKGLHVAS